MKSWLKGGLIALGIVLIYFIIVLIYKLLALPVYSRPEVIRDFIFSILLYLVPSFIFGVSIGSLVSVKKEEWKTLSFFKKYLVVASGLFILIFVLLAIYFFIISLPNELNLYNFQRYPPSNYQDFDYSKINSCPALVDSVHCRVSGIPTYVVQGLLISGIPLFILILIIGIVGNFFQKNSTTKARAK